MSGDVVRRVYVISDLHIGGSYGKNPKDRGFRLNTHVSELTQFVHSLADNLSALKIELVINGDFIDFLAEKERTPPCWSPFTYDVEVACRKLHEAIDRDRPFFDALHSLLEKGHRLTILLGNHDIELALPPVRQRLKELIGVHGHHDYELIGNGEAYVVGDALIEHGNRYDSFNMVDHDALRRMCSLYSRRQFQTACVFDPPAGSKMVSWIINEIKEDYAFIDLLKPETDVAIPVLLALEPGYRRLLATVAKLGLQAREHRLETPALPSFGGDIHSCGESNNTSSFNISINSDDAMGSRPSNYEEPLAEILKKDVVGDSDSFLQALVPVGSAQEPQTGSDISATNLFDRTFGVAKLLLSANNQDLTRRLPALLKALRSLQPDRSFELDFESAPVYCSAATKLFEGGFRYVVFGHTHQPKKIELKPKCWYLNSGTWADLIRLPPEIITGSPEVAMAKVQQLMLDIATNNLDGWVVFRPTFVRLDVDANKVVQAGVYEYSGPASVTQGTPMSKTTGA